MPSFSEFEEIPQAAALLRSGVELKFELADDLNEINGSPIYALALNRTRDEMISGYAQHLGQKKSQEVADWYLLSGHPHRWHTVARRAASHPRWRNLSDAEMREWIEVISAPLRVDEEGFSRILEICKERDWF